MCYKQKAFGCIWYICYMYTTLVMFDLNIYIPKVKVTKQDTKCKHILSLISISVIFFCMQ